MFELNPIDVLRKREVKIMPPHFQKIQITDSELYQLGESEWIQKKLKGRFCITTIPDLDKENKLINATYVGFENSKEMTYFMLACPFLRRN